MLRRQYEHDEPLVRSGKHLFFSPFFQVGKFKFIFVILTKYSV